MSIGSYFGEEEIIFKCKRKHTVIAKTESEIYQLSKEDFENIIQPNFPYIYKELLKVATEKVKLNIEWENKIKTIIKFQLKIMIGKSVDKKRSIDNKSIISNSVHNITNIKTKIGYDKDTKDNFINAKMIQLDDFIKKYNEKNYIEELIDGITVTDDSVISDNSYDSKEIKSIGLKKIYNKYLTKIGNINLNIIKDIQTKRDNNMQKTADNDKNYNNIKEILMKINDLKSLINIQNENLYKSINNLNMIDSSI